MSGARKKKPLSGRVRRVICAALLILFLTFGYTEPGKAMWGAWTKAFGLAHFTQALPEDALHIHVLRVGKADAILLESPDAAILVDCGTADTTDEILRYLDARGITRLDAVWISHPDADHRGGLQAVLETVPVNVVVESAYAESLEELVPLPDALSLLQAEAGDRYTYGDMAFEVLAPDRDYADANDASVVFRLRYGAFTMLFCGDIQEAGERALLESGENLHADVLKVAHHGSNSSTSAEFLALVQPAYAVISSGVDRNMLPRNAVLKRLADAQVRVFRTDTDGTVVLSVQSDAITVTTENAGHAL